MNNLFLFANIDPVAQAQAELSEKNAADWLNGDPVAAAVGAVLVALLVVAWAVFFRKPKRTVSVTPEEAARAFLTKSGGRRRKQHRYPTLAESGGLPPVRTKS